jgi:hypothetical protein
MLRCSAIAGSLSRPKSLSQPERRTAATAPPLGSVFADAFGARMLLGERLRTQ